MEPNFNKKCTEYKNKYDCFIPLLKARLTEKRFFHSLCVAKESVRLAEKYGYDTDKAFLAGLLHDILKDTNPNEQLKLLAEFDIMLDNIEKSAPKLWHAIAGAAYIENVLKIKDIDIISAVRYHTTAKRNMNLAEKILYLADFTSEDRDYEGVEKMRIYVDESLDKAMYEALEFSVWDLKNKNTAIHKDTMEAWNEIKSKKESLDESI